MWTLIFWAVAAAATVAFLYKAWDGFTDSIGAPYAETQRKADQVKMDEADQRARNARADTASCVAKADGQSKAVESAQKEASDARKATKAIMDAAKLDAKVKQQHIASLQSIASAVPKKDMKCEEELGKSKAILQETLRARRAAPVGPVTPRDALGLPK